MDEAQLIKQLIVQRTKLQMELKLLPKRIEALENAIIGLGGTVPLTNDGVDNISDSSPDYPYKGTITSKILYILSKTGEKRTAKELADFIAHKDNSMNPDITYRTVTLTASNLYNDGKIKADKEGIRNVYYL